MSPRQNRTSNRILLGLLFALLLLPAVQTWLNMKILRSNLSGYQAQAAKPTWDWDSLLAGTYQPALERYATEHLGLREQLIRPRNQVAYSLFGRSTNQQIIIGRDGALFEEGSIAAALGQAPPVPPAELRQRVREFRALQDTLARRGKLLVLTIPPAKAALYAELLPEAYQTAARPDSSNYQRYAGALRAAGVNVVDFVPVFRRWKATTPYPLFPRGGTHWSGYGVVRAADTLFRYVARRGGFRLRDIQVGPPEVSTTPRYTDNDIAKTLNLLWDPAPWPLAYSPVTFGPLPAGQPQPRLLLVGDSFGWSFIEFYPYAAELFAPGSHYWYYNREVQWTNDNPTHHVPAEQYEVGSLDRRAQLAAHDVVLVIVNEANLASFDFGFSADMLRALTTP